MSDIGTHLSDIGTFFVNEVFQLLLQFGAKIQEKGHVRTSLYVPRAPMQSFIKIGQAVWEKNEVTRQRIVDL